MGKTNEEYVKVFSDILAQFIQLNDGSVAVAIEIASLQNIIRDIETINDPFHDNRSAYVVPAGCAQSGDEDGGGGGTGTAGA
jgi:hypothetical protein